MRGSSHMPPSEIFLTVFFFPGPAYSNLRVEILQNCFGLKSKVTEKIFFCQANFLQDENRSHSKPKQMLPCVT